MKKLIIIGGGGHALSVLEAMDTSIEIAGYVDNIESKKLILPYLGNDEFVLSNFSPEEYRVHHAVVYTNDVNLSLKFFELIAKSGLIPVSSNCKFNVSAILVKSIDQR